MASKKQQKQARPTQKRTKTKVNKLNIILQQQQKILKNEEAIKKDEAKIITDDNRIEQEETTTANQETSELNKLEALEQEVKQQVTPHPLTRITIKDFMKAIIGSFVGVVVHFTFTYGVEVAANISETRATALFIFSFIIGGVFLYATGFRKIKDQSMTWLLPYRLIVLYTTAVVVTALTLWFFYPTFGVQPGLAYRQLATVNLSAIIGACTADLIGRD